MNVRTLVAVSLLLLVVAPAHAERRGWLAQLFDRGSHYVFVENPDADYYAAQRIVDRYPFRLENMQLESYFGSKVTSWAPGYRMTARFRALSTGMHSFHVAMRFPALNQFQAPELSVHHAPKRCQIYSGMKRANCVNGYRPRIDPTSDSSLRPFPGTLITTKAALECRVRLRVAGHTVINATRGMRTGEERDQDLSRHGYGGVKRDDLFIEHNCGNVQRVAGAAELVAGEHEVDLELQCRGARYYASNSRHGQAFVPGWPVYQGCGEQMKRLPGEKPNGDPATEVEFVTLVARPGNSQPHPINIDTLRAGTR